MSKAAIKNTGIDTPTKLPATVDPAESSSLPLVLLGNPADHSVLFHSSYVKLEFNRGLKSKSAAVASLELVVPFQQCLSKHS